MKKSNKAFVTGLSVLVVVSGFAAFELASPGMELRRSFANSSESQRMTLLEGGKWEFDQLACPYSKVKFSRSEILGLPGKHSRYIASDSTAAITYREGKSGDVFIVSFNRTSAFDPCSSK